MVMGIVAVAVAVAAAAKMAAMVLVVDACLTAYSSVYSSTAWLTAGSSMSIALFLSNVARHGTGSTDSTNERPVTPPPPAGSRSNRHLELKSLVVKATERGWSGIGQPCTELN